MKQFAPLTRTELEKLNDKINMGASVSVVMVVCLFPYILAGLWASISMLSNGIDSLESFFWAIFPALISIILIYFPYTIFKSNKKEEKILEKDYENGVKEIFQTKIDDKIIEDSPSYFFVSGTEKYETDQKIYDKTKIGQEIMVHIAPLSRTVLKIILLENTNQDSENLNQKI